MPKSNKVLGKKMNKIYLDYAASASPNPSSIHNEGVKAKNNLENARIKVASILSARPQEIIFTSGGTESNNLAISGFVFAWHEKNTKGILPHIITTNIEHPSVLETFKILEKRKLAEISIVPVEVSGIVDPRKIKKEIKQNTVLVSVMYANNEIGTIQPIREIAKEIRHYKKNNEEGFYPFFHIDAVQAVNYLDLNVERLGVDMLTLSGSKIVGSGRVGVLYKRKSVPLVGIMGGGDQEQGFRPGTENLSEIIKFANAFEAVQKIKDKENKRLTNLQDYFIEQLHSSFFFSGPRFSGAPHPGQTIQKRTTVQFLVNGDVNNRLPNNVNVTFPKIPSDLLVIELSARGIMVSSKSACKSSSNEGSYVIKAIHPESDSEIGGVRFSFGFDTTKKDIDYTIKSLSQILTKLKKWYN